MSCVFMTKYCSPVSNVLIYSIILWRLCGFCYNFSKTHFLFAAYPSYSIHFNLHMFPCLVLCVFLYFCEEFYLNQSISPSLFPFLSLPSLFAVLMVCYSAASCQHPHHLSWRFYIPFPIVSSVLSYLLSFWLNLLRVIIITNSPLKYILKLEENA